MPIFKLNMLGENNNPYVLYYDSDNGYLLNEQNKPYPLPPLNFLKYKTKPPKEQFKEATKFNTFDTPVVRSKSGRITDIRLYLGAKCNYKCSYCYQNDVRDKEVSITLAGAERFINEIDTWYDGGEDGKGKGTTVQFWGGEPLVYWKMITKIIESIEQKYPNLKYGMVTNGSLLDDEVADFILARNFTVNVSHDGPAQHYRGEDPLQNIVSRNAIIRLYDQHILNFNPTLHVDNYSKQTIFDFFATKFRNLSRIGEGDFIENFNFEQEGQTNLAIPNSHVAHTIARTTISEYLNNPELTSIYSIVVQRTNLFLNSIYFHQPIDTIQDFCGTTKSSRMIIDGNGDMLLCHHGKRENNVNTCGSNANVKDLNNNAIYSATHWSYKPNCRSCPVIAICQGSCPFVENESQVVNCHSSFYDTISVFAFALYMITGLRLMSIEGEHTKAFPDREDIFGMNDNEKNCIDYMKALKEKPKKKMIMLKQMKVQ